MIYNEFGLPGMFFMLFFMASPTWAHVKPAQELDFKVGPETATKLAFLTTLYT